MKYVCEICGCTADNVETMQQHEIQCREKNASLIYCADELNTLIGMASVAMFTIVAEIPGEKETKYYKVTAAELDGKKNRCVLKVKNDEAENSAAESKTKSNKK